MSYNPSALMSAYNEVKQRGRRAGLWTSERVDRALGYLMDGQAVEKWAEYTTTTERCDCPDSEFRREVCKHSLALMIDLKHNELMAEFRRVN